MIKLYDSASRSIAKADDGTPSPYSSFLYSGQMTITDFGVGNDMIYFSNIRLFKQLAGDESPHDDEQISRLPYFMKNTA